MRYLPLIALLSLLLSLTACRSPLGPGASADPQTAEHFEVEQKQILAADYLLFLPADYDANSDRRWPLILFLHGAGERGSNPWLITKYGPPKMVAHDKKFPFILVSPQCPPGKIWSNDLLLALLDDVTKKYAVDTRRIYLTGISMGGFGTWSLGLSHPEKFAAIAPICGGGDFITPHLADKTWLTTLPVWAFHGAKDPIVPMEESARMVGLLRRLGAKEVKFTVYPEAQHDCWTKTYANPELFAWFLKHSR